MSEKTKLAYVYWLMDCTGPQLQVYRSRLEATRNARADALHGYVVGPVVRVDVPLPEKGKP